MYNELSDRLNPLSNSSRYPITQGAAARLGPRGLRDEKDRGPRDTARGYHVTSTVATASVFSALPTHANATLIRSQKRGGGRPQVRPQLQRRAGERDVPYRHLNRDLGGKTSPASPHHSVTTRQIPESHPDRRCHTFLIWPLSTS